MKKYLLSIYLLSTLCYGKVIVVKEQIKSSVTKETIYDFSKVNKDFIKIKETDGTLYIINKKFITDIKIYTNNSMYIEFISYSTYGNSKTVKVHEDSYIEIYKYLTEKGDNNE